MKYHLKCNFKHCIDNLLMFSLFGCYKKKQKNIKKIVFDNDVQDKLIVSLFYLVMVDKT
jgi:hypothetical protein